VTQKGEEQNLETASTGFKTGVSITHINRMLQIYMISPSKHQKYIKVPSRAQKTLCCKGFADLQFVMKPTSLKSHVDRLLIPSGKLIIKSRLAHINVRLFSEQ
jgi:hypothetical protein